MMSILKKASMALAGMGLVALMAAGPSNAQTVCYFTDNNNGVTNPEGPITANGYSPVHILDITTFNFAPCNIVMINNSSNGGVSAGYLGRLGDLTTYVRGGGSLVFHDRTVTNANTYTPGAAGITFVRDFTFDADLNIVTGGTAVTNGPFGTITNTNLDGGTSSSHGYALAGTLPGGAVNILSNGTDATHSAAFVYPLGAGFVYYSTIPLDFYLNGSGPNPPRDNFNLIYAPNVLFYEHGLQGIPEPGSLGMLLGAAVTGLGFLMRRWLRRG